jgi:hypothetical protein
MSEKRNPIKQIMSQVHKDARASKIDLYSRPELPTFYRLQRRLRNHR